MLCGYSNRSPIQLLERCIQIYFTVANIASERFTDSLIAYDVTVADAAVVKPLMYREWFTASLSCTIIIITAVVAETVVDM